MVKKEKFEETRLILEKLKDYFVHKIYTHLVINAFHYNGFITDIDANHIKFEDKYGETYIFKISDISVIEKTKRGYQE